MNDDIIMMPVPRSSFTAVCALLGGASLTALATSAPVASPTPAPAPQGTATVASEGNSAQAAVADTSGGDTAGAASDSGALDAAGWPWSADLHASTKGQTKEGLWRMKVGVSRPDPKPGFPKADGAATTSANTTASEPTPAAAAAVEDDDEFAMFREAAGKSDATDASAAAAIPPRKWTDADLGAICNQAAVKLGDPTPVKALIAKYVPEGQVAHSRNIADDKREEFAVAVEKAAGITYAAG